MKKLAILLIIALCLPLFAACEGQDKMEEWSELPTGAPSEIATEAETEVETQAITEEKLTNAEETTNEEVTTTGEATTTEVGTTKEEETTTEEVTTKEEVTTEPETKAEPETEDVMDQVDFIVSVTEGKEPVILQLTDPQIIDASQQRSEDRLNATTEEYWAPDQKDERCYDYLREIINATNPDLILVTGDIVYGEFDDNGENFVEFIAFMEGFDIPWAPVFGNHDNESNKGADWQCDQLEAAENCLFMQRNLTGNGNYTVGIEQGGKLTRVFFMLDSNGCGAASSASMANGHTQKTAGFGSDQIAWYTTVAQKLKALSPDTKLSMAFHMQIAAFKDAMSQYAVDGSYTNIFIDEVSTRNESDFGFTGRGAKGAWDDNYTVWNSIKSLGFDSVFVGHEHSNSSSIVYQGIRLQYGMKCSTYDRNNYIKADGTIVVAAYHSTETPRLGGSVFSLGSAGEIKDPHIYYCGSNI